jgi:hypothetical protein
MKNKDLYVFQDGLKKAKFNHPRAAYAVTKNKRLVDKAIKDMEGDYIKPSEEFNKYLVEAEDVAKRLSKKDDKGNPITKDVVVGPGEKRQVYDIETGPGTEYFKDIEKLNKKNKDIIELRNNQLFTYQNEFLEEESDFVPHPLNISVLEEQWRDLTVEQRELQFPQELIDQIQFMVVE